MRNNSTVLVLVIVLLLIPGVLAEYSIDISGLEESYSVGEEISYTVILLEDGNVIQRDLEVTFFDDLGKKSIVQQVVSNQKYTLLVNNDFSSIGWKAKAVYEGKEIARSFLITENAGVEFSIEDGKLIIRNTGNVRYTRDVQMNLPTEQSSGVSKRTLLI